VATAAAAAAPDLAKTNKNSPQHLLFLPHPVSPPTHKTTNSVVARHFETARPSLAAALAGNKSSDGEEEGGATAAAAPLPPLVERSRAALRVLLACPSLVQSWDDTAPLFELLAKCCFDEHERDPHAAWAAARCVALLSHLAPAASSALASAAARAAGGGRGAPLECELAWEEEERVAAVARAGHWLGGERGGGGGKAPPAAPPATPALPLSSSSFSPANATPPSPSASSSLVVTPAALPSLPPPPGFVDICGVWLPRCKRGNDNSSPHLFPRSFVATPAALSALRAAALAVADGRPLLVEGPAGCGKTALIAALAYACGASPVLTLHAGGDAADARALLGCYVAAPPPTASSDASGSSPAPAFSWSPGPLSLAVARGRWLVLEGAEAAPADAAAAIGPLLDGGPLQLPSRGQTLRPSPGFRLIAAATTRSAPAGPRAAAAATSRAAPATATRSAAALLDRGGWSRVVLRPPSREDAAAVLSARLPQGSAAAAALAAIGLECLSVARLAEGLPAVSGSSDDNDGGDGDGDGDSSPSAHASALLASVGLSPGGAARSGRQPSLRDACRWASRVATRAPAAAAWMLGSSSASASASARPSSSSSPSCSLPTALRELAAAEAADVFAGAAPDPDARCALAGALAAACGLPAAWGSARVAHGSPALAVAADAVSVGRARLPVAPGRSAAALRASRAAGAARAAGGGPSFAPTAAARRSLEALAAALSAGGAGGGDGSGSGPSSPAPPPPPEPVLLVGETGAGKTSAVQWLAAQAGATLDVVNLSQSSDAADLVGGFRPSSAADAARGLLGSLAELMRKTWPRGEHDAFLEAAAKALSRKQWGRVAAACKVALAKVRKEGRSVFFFPSPASLSSSPVFLWSAPEKARRAMTTKLEN